MHVSQLKPAPSQNTTELDDDDYNDEIVHSMPEMPPVGTPVCTDHQAPILERRLPQDGLDHLVRWSTAIVPRAPPAAEEASAQWHSIRVSRMPVRYVNPVVLPNISA